MRLYALPAMLCAFASLACRTTPLSSVLGAPGVREPARVSGVALRGAYLDATLGVRPRELRLFFPADAACRALLHENATVVYVLAGWLGEVQALEGSGRCEAVGVASLAAWRDRTYARPSRGLPREQASFKSVYQDADVALARGTFPLAGRAGWPYGQDTLGVFPQTSDCRAILEAGAAAIEFRDRGDEPLVLLEGRKRCALLGFVRPG